MQRGKFHRIHPLDPYVRTHRLHDMSSTVALNINSGKAHLQDSQTLISVEKEKLESPKEKIASRCALYQWPKGISQAESPQFRCLQDPDSFYTWTKVSESAAVGNGDTIYRDHLHSALGDATVRKCNFSVARSSLFQEKPVTWIVWIHQVLD